MAENQPFAEGITVAITLLDHGLDSDTNSLLKPSLLKGLYSWLYMFSLIFDKDLWSITKKGKYITQSAHKSETSGRINRTFV